jgi:integrase
MKGLLHVHKKNAKGRTYYYFDTGAKKDGKPILTRLPDVRDPTFARSYQTARAARTRRGGVQDVRTFEWLVNAFEASPELKAKAENTKRLYLRHLRYAVQSFRNAEGKSWPLGILTSNHVLILRDKYAHKPGTANAILKSLGALFAWAKKPGRGYMKEHLSADVDALGMGEHEPWPEDLIEAALSADDATIRLGVALLYFAGQRIGDTVRMGRGNVTRGALGVTQQKTGLSLTIPLHERLAAIIEADAPKDAITFLVNERGKSLTESGLRQRIQKWAKDLGFEIVPHGLRKNAVNALLEAGCSVAETAAISGQTLQVIEHYAKRRNRKTLGASAILKWEGKQ